MSYQRRVWDWMLNTFSMHTCQNQAERNMRYLEESLELVQSLTLPRGKAHELVDYVYDRPVGETPQEIGGVMVTLAALCQANRHDMEDCAALELERCWMNQENIRAKHKLKPTEIQDAA